MTLRIQCLTIDCHDLDLVATFWAEHGGAYAAPRMLIRDFLFTGTCER